MFIDWNTSYPKTWKDKQSKKVPTDWKIFVNMLIKIQEDTELSASKRVHNN